MDQKTKDYLIEKVDELINSATCCEDAKTAGKEWLDSIGTDKESEKAKVLVEELEMDIMTVDGLIEFASSEAGAKVFGADKAKEVAAHGEEIKKAGAKYCDCPACAACEAILEKKAELIG